MSKNVAFHRGAAVVAILALSVLVAGNVEAGDKKNFTAHLNGAKQVPSPVDTQAQGQAIDAATMQQPVAAPGPEGLDTELLLRSLNL